MELRTLDLVVTQAVSTGLMAEESVRALAARIYGDGVVDRLDADLLFDLDDALKQPHQAWSTMFRGAIKDHVLNIGPPARWVNEAEADWLIKRLSRQGELLSDLQIDMLLDILRHAEGAPEKLGAFALDAVCARIVHEGRVLRPDLDRLRRALHAPSGEGAVWVTRREACALFELNDKIADANNEAGWTDLFARAIGNHLLAAAHPSPSNIAAALARDCWLTSDTKGVAGVLAQMAGSFSDGGWFDKVAYDPKRAATAREAARAAAERKANEVDASETTWILKRLRWDGRISPAERALVDFLKAEAPGFADGLAVAA